MFAVDSSTLIAFGNNEQGEDIELFMKAILEEKIKIPPAVIGEVLSNPHHNNRIEQVLLGIKELEINEGYWQRVGSLRCTIIKQKLKAHFADTLIAQSCIDHSIPLITRDEDFRHFVKFGGLKLAV